MSLFLSATAQGPSGYLSLEDLARRSGSETDGRSALAVPAEAQRLVNLEHRLLGWQWSYGDYGVVRRTAWKGIPYLEERQTFLHLGCDFNIGAGTGVYLPRPGTVVRVDNDAPEEFGWGGRVTVKLKRHPVCLIFAHLDPETIACRAGQDLPLNVLLGRVGQAHCNGGWYEHVHVQALVYRAFEHFNAGRWDQLDGYGREEDRHKLLHMCPDPMPYLRVWQ